MSSTPAAAAADLSLPTEPARQSGSLAHSVLLIVVTVLAFSPATVSSGVPSVGETIALVAGLAALVLINLISFRRAVRPVEELTRVMSEVDPLRPGRRLPKASGSAETAKLAAVFNDMLPSPVLDR